MKKKLSTGKKVGIGIVALAVIGSLAGGGDKKDDNVVAEKTTTAITSTMPETKPAETKPAETKPAETKPAETKPAETKPAETKPPKTIPAETKPKLTKGQENAIRSAENYISIMSFSKKGLVKQLKFEGYSEGDAKFAVDYIDVDWMEQAVRSGANYLELIGQGV